jgi:hypothetical protein
MVENFPKTEKIEIRLNQKIADKLPKDKKERNAFVCRAIEYAVNGERQDARKVENPI